MKKNESGHTHPFPGNRFACVTEDEAAGAFPLVRQGKPAPLWTDPSDHAGVVRAVGDLKADLGRVSGTEPAVLFVMAAPAQAEIVIIGTLGKNRIIDALVREKKIDASAIRGEWEAYLIQVVDSPFPGIRRALVVAGSDKRGAIYGVYELSEQAGVSPWYWWADVPVRQRRRLYVLPGPFIAGAPKVKYRGIFINDEAPALAGWAGEKFGGLNHAFYEKVFELILRLKGNFLWPAMWDNAFCDDDPANPRKADEYGIVVGNSHHEPCLRAHKEWRLYGKGPWQYEKNSDVLREFWREGIRRMGGHESMVTVGMRGDGDEPMREESDIALLGRIVEDQRRIIREETGRDPRETAQLWAVYKEVQDYYDRGMEVPEDVTLLLCDDNWGDVRRVPPPEKRNRAGGFGMYYHFDYVGGPRNFKWLNTTQIARVWEQMQLAYRTGIDRIWIVNVGDIKPMEFPLSFFLDLAWDPDRMTVERMADYARRWAECQFGQETAEQIASILTRYTTYNARRKPELLSPETYSLLHYREAETVVTQYQALCAEAEELEKTIPQEYRDAFFQLVLHPVLACANLNELYVTVAKNRLYAQQGRALTNALARHARDLFERDARITRRYNETLAGGKWNHFMDQTHIGYTSWQQPERNVMPEVREIALSEKALLGVAVEGSADSWPGAANEARLPVFDPYLDQEYYIEAFNRGGGGCDVSLRARDDWLLITPAAARVETETRFTVRVDWRKAPTGIAGSVVTVRGPDGRSVDVAVAIQNSPSPLPREVKGFVESGGCVSMNAEHFARAVDLAPVFWQVIPGLGRTASGVTAYPVTAPAHIPGANGPRLEYRMHVFSPGAVRVLVYVSPSLDFRNSGGLRYAVSLDDEKPVVVNLHADETPAIWERSVADAVRIGVSEHRIKSPGHHMLNLWLVDTGVVFQKIVVDGGGAQPCYLGPPESFYRA